MNRKIIWTLSIVFSLILMIGLFQSVTTILAAPTVETGTVTISKAVTPSDTYTDFEFSILSPGNPSEFIIFGSEGAGPSQFDWSQAGVDVDANGNIYVSDEFNHRVQKFDKNGVFLLAWGKGVNGGAGYETCTSGCVAGTTGTAEGEFNSPSDLAVGSSNMVYVVDTMNHRIQKFNNNGVFQQAWGWGVDTGASASEVCTSGCQQGIFGSGDGQLFLPKGITFASNTLFVVDKGNNRIQYFDNNGVYGGKWGGAGTAEGEFNNPTGIGIVSGNVVVADTSNHRIQVFDNDGAFQRAWGWGVITGKNQFEVCSSDCQAGVSGDGNGQLSSPLDVDGDISGYTYVADGNNRVMKFDSLGNPKMTWGSTGSGSGQFDGLGAIAIDNLSQVITLDINNYQVKTFVASSFLLNDYLSTIDGIPQTITYQLPVGSYTIKELYNDYWWNTPVINCTTNDTGDNPVVNSPGVSINLNSGETVNCTYNNAFEQGSITFIKESIPDDGTDFHYLWGEIDQPDFYYLWGERGSNENQFNNPAGIEVDADNQVYVVDTFNNRIQKFNENREFVSAWGWGVTNGANSYQICTTGCQAGNYGTGNGQLNSPVGAAFDSSYNLYIVDRDNHRVQKFDQDGTYLNKWGTQGTGEGEFDLPTWVAVDQYDNIYVVDSGNFRIQKFDPDGNFVRTWGWGVAGGTGFETCTSSCFPGISGSGNGQFSQAAGIGISPSDHVYVADTVTNQIQYFDLDGNYLGNWGAPGSSDGQFDQPVGVSTDSDGGVFIADFGNDRIQKFDEDGTFLSSWGYSGKFEYGFDGPFGIATAGNGMVVISDLNNQRIKQYAVTWITLDDEPDPNDDDMVDHDIQFVGKPGNYKMTELEVTGWYLDSIVCETNQTGDDPVVVLPTVFINLDGNEDMTCTFNNVKYEEVVADFSGNPTSGLAPLQVNFSNLSTGDFDSCSWDFGDGGSSSDCNNPPHSFTSSGIYTVSLTASGPGGNDTETKVDYITVTEPVSPNFSGSPTSGIAPLTVDFTNTSTGDFDTCSWDFGDGGSTSVCTDPSYEYTNSGIFTVTLVISGTGGLDTETKPDYITVYEPVQADFVSDKIQGSPPLDVNFTNTSTGDFDTCSWDFGDGGTSNVCFDPSHTFNSVGTYTVFLIVSGDGGEDTETKVDFINVSIENMADFSGSPTTGIAPLNVVFTNLSIGDYDTCNWDFGDGGSSTECNDPSHTFTNSGIYTVSLAIDGAAGQDSKTIVNYITVYETVDPNFSGSPTSGIAPLNVDFINESTGDFDTCSWDFGDGGTSNECHPSAYNYTTSGVYTVSLTIDGNGGSDTVTKNNYITVYEPVVAEFSGNPTSGVIPMQVDFTNLSTGDFDTCYWDFGDGGTSNVCTDPSHSYTSSGTFTVSLTVSGPGGSDTETKEGFLSGGIQVEAGFSGTPRTGVAPLDVTFTNESTGDFDVCSWDFGDTNTSNECNPPSHSYTNTGVYTVSLTVSGLGGEDTETKPSYIEVSFEVIAAFSGSPQSGIAPLDVNFTNESTGDYDTCSWDFGDGGTSSNCSNPSHSYTNPGTYTVSLTVTGPGGSDTETKNDYITAYQQVVADFSNSPASGIAPTQVQFTNNSSGDFSSCTWNFGDGNTNNSCSNPSHTYSSGGVFTVTLSISGNGGSDSLSKQNLITIYVKTEADFNASPMTGFDPLDVDFTNLSSGDFDTCLWEFGDGGTSNVCGNPSHIYTGTGTFSVTLTVNGDGGESMKTKANYITVTQSAFAEFSANPTEDIDSAFVSFTNLSGGDYQTCTWNFGDGVTLQSCSNPNHLYSDPGFYTVSLTITAVSGDDTETKVDYIKVYTPTSAAFSATPLQGSTPLEVTFTNESTGDYSTCNWDFGDGNLSTNCNPMHTYNTAGKFTVTLTIDGKGGESYTEEYQYITVNSAAVAQFSASPTQGTVPLQVNFTNQATGEFSACHWDFGDGNTSDSCANQNHTYTSTGTFTVELTVSGTGGEDTETKPNYITVSDNIFLYIPLVLNQFTTP